VTQEPITYLFPIETLIRELDYKLLLAAVLRAPHRRFVICRHDIAPKLVPALRGGVFVGQHIRTRTEGDDDYSRLDQLHEQGFRVLHLDEEGAVYSGDEREWTYYVTSRLDARRLEPDDAVCTWGDFQRGALAERAPERAHRIFATGHPRLDLCGGRYAAIYDDEEQRLRERYGDFVLINTNFTFANYVTGEAGLFSRREGYRPDDESARLRFIGHWSRASTARAAFVDMVHRASARFPRAAFVVRAHPSENHDFYRTVFRGVANIHVAHEGNVIPWLRAARAMIHNSCTTGLEGHLARASIIRYSPRELGDGESWLASLFGTRAYTFDDVRDALERALGGERLARSVADDERRRAAQLVAQLRDDYDDSAATTRLARMAEEVEAGVASMRRFDEARLRTSAMRHGARALGRLAADRAIGVVKSGVRPPKFSHIDPRFVARRLDAIARVVGTRPRMRLLGPTAMVLD
jgi:surface carbohydrate biosynthesis protein